MSDATLDAPCPHGHYEPHDAPDPTSSHWERCPGGSRRPVAEIPWCAEHDEKMDTFDPEFNVGWCRKVDDCRLEEPARHYVVGEAE